MLMVHVKRLYATAGLVQRLGHSNKEELFPSEIQL